MVSFLIISLQTTYILDIQANMFPCPIGQGIGVFRTDLVSVDDGRLTLSTMMNPSNQDTNGSICTK